MSAGSFFEKRRSWLMSAAMILLLVIAVSRTNYGLWDADIPLGDDAIYIEQAFRLYEQNQWSTNLYFDLYIAIFNYLSADPIIAHYWVRYLGSLLSVIALFLLLSSLRFVSRFGAFVMALFWSLNLLNSPLLQFGNVNLLVFAMVCFAGYLWLVQGTCGRLIAGGILLAAISVRNEYVLLLLVLVSQRLWLWLSCWGHEGLSRRYRKRLGGAAALLLTALVASVAVPTLRQQATSYLAGLNDYFFLGFTQHYSIYNVATDPALHLDPYTEYDLLISEKFPGATDFFSAVRANPTEVGKYLISNIISNLTRFYYILPGHSILLPSGLVTNGLTGGHASGDFVSRQFPGYAVLWIEQALTVLFIAAGACWLLLVTVKQFSLRCLALHDDAVFVIGLAAVASLSFILHIPDPRYWIMTIPLLYWGGAALLSKYCSPSTSGRTLGLAVLVSLIMVNPVFSSALNRSPHTNKAVALALRDKLLSTSGQSAINALGYYPQPLLSFALPGRGTGTDNMAVRRNSSYEALVQLGSYDLVIIDSRLRKTAQYQREEPFFTRFLRSPEDHGYKLLLDTEQRDGPIRIFQRQSTE